MTLPGAHCDPTEVPKVDEAIAHVLRILSRIPVAFIRSLRKQKNEGGRRYLLVLAEFGECAEDLVPRQKPIGVRDHRNRRSPDLNGYWSGKPLKPAGGLLRVLAVEPLLEKQEHGVSGGCCSLWHRSDSIKQTLPRRSSAAPGSASDPTAGLCAPMGTVRPGSRPRNRWRLRERASGPADIRVCRVRIKGF